MIIQECCPPCNQIQTVNTPGSPGASGFTAVLLPFTIPALNASVTISVLSTSMMETGMNLFIGGANFLLTGINSLTSITVTYLGYPTDTATGVSVPVGALVVSGPGNFPNPIPVAIGGTGVQTIAALATALNAQLSALFGGGALPVADGGTGGSTLTAALASLGIAQSINAGYGSGSSYLLTNTPAQIVMGTSSPSVTIGTAGVYLFIARARVDLVGATFAANQTVQIKIRRVVGAAGDIANAVVNHEFDIVTTKSYTAFNGDLPLTQVTCALGDVIQLWGGLSASTSAGSVQVVEATLIAIPLHLP